ncbi:MAG: hypothetical protein A3C22_02200 [Candidatus Levybacteria bacterium RIFCSPHIGHO2_02_FULL_37_10]|nr:MAG: hypothetical protein A3C22_02200 [Candidatus Levybacteria bacterium RIFCSPHIGHO2_02_FULL_37_10]
MYEKRFEKKSSEKLILFFKKFKLLRYNKGDIILRAEDIPSGVFYLKKGCVRLYSVSKDGEELTLIIFKSGNVFPLMWSINNTPNQYHLEAMTQAELYRSPRDKFLGYIKVNPDVMLELFKHVLARFGGVLQRMEYLVFGDAYAKIASILVILADRFGEKRTADIRIQVPLIHKDVAMLVGVTRETASIELGKLEKKGIIKHKGKAIIIKDIKKLKKESLLSF